MATGEIIGCFGLTEPDYGSESRRHEDTAPCARGTAYVLNGAKMWITNGSIADVAVVWAKEADGEIMASWWSAARPASRRWTSTASSRMRASVTSSWLFQDCRIPLENKLPKAKGLNGPLGCLNQARYGIAWGAVGALMAVYDWSLQYAQERIQFGKPIGAFQLVQQKLVWMITEITKAQLLVLQLGRLKDAGKVRPQQVSMAKLNNVQVALDGARLARDIIGAARHRGRAPRHPPHAESGDRQYVRGDARYPYADRGPGYHGTGRVRDRVRQGSSTRRTVRHAGGLGGPSRPPM